MFFLFGLAIGYLVGRYQDQLPAVWEFLKKQFAAFKKDGTPPPPPAA